IYLLLVAFHNFSVLLPFPTRRSSDLVASPLPNPTTNRLAINGHRVSIPKVHNDSPIPMAKRLKPPVMSGMKPTLCRIEPPSRARSEEHTSELQSRFDLVCRLLLEKKK